LTTHVSQGSAATDLRGGDSFNSSILRMSFLNWTVKKLWNLVHYSRSYRGLLFGDTGIQLFIKEQQMMQSIMLIFRLLYII